MKSTFLTLVLLSYSAQASDWIKVGMTTKSAVFYIDKNSIKHKNNEYAAWVKIVQPNGNYGLEFMVFENDFVKIPDTSCYRRDGSNAPWYSPWCTTGFGYWDRVRPDTGIDKIYKWLKQHTSLWF